MDCKFLQNIQSWVQIFEFAEFQMWVAKKGDFFAARICNLTKIDTVVVTFYDEEGAMYAGYALSLKTSSLSEIFADAEFQKILKRRTR
jgi:hypothetical protein